MKELVMVKVVINDNADSEELLSFIRTSVNSKKGYLIELVQADLYPGFIDNENITTFPTIYVDYSTRKIEGLSESIRYFKDNF